VSRLRRSPFYSVQVIFYGIWLETIVQLHTNGWSALIRNGVLSMMSDVNSTRGYGQGDQRESRVI
jgi:hypothetical protein